jgi:hypothetical protein
MSLGLLSLVVVLTCVLLVAGYRMRERQRRRGGLRREYLERLRATRLAKKFMRDRRERNHLPEERGDGDISR